MPGRYRRNNRNGQAPRNTQEQGNRNTNQQNYNSNRRGNGANGGRNNNRGPARQRNRNKRNWKNNGHDQNIGNRNNRSREHSNNRGNQNRECNNNRGENNQHWQNNNATGPNARSHRQRNQNEQQSNDEPPSSMTQLDASEYPMNILIQTNGFVAREFEECLHRRKFYDSFRWLRDSDGDLIMVDPVTERPVWFSGRWQHPCWEIDLQSGPMCVEGWDEIDAYDETADYDEEYF